jgi:hypothetical protein
MSELCSVCGERTDQLGQCARHSDAGIVQLLENFNPQPIEPGYLGEEISQLMYDAAAIIRRKDETIKNLEVRISDLLDYYRPKSN